MAESAGASTITLTDEIFPLPSEVDDVFNQLEALSSQVQRLQRAEDISIFRRASARRAPAATVQAGIEQLRMNVQRLRCRSGSPSSGDHSTSQCNGDVNPTEMLRTLELLRGEIEELIEQVNGDMVSDASERLPSYHSRRAVHVLTPDLAPPLPHQDYAKDMQEVEL